MAGCGGPGRSVLIGVFVGGLALCGQGPVGWNTRLQQGLADMAQGQYADAVQILSPLKDEAKAFPTDDLRRAEATLALATAYQYQGQIQQAQALFLESKGLLEPIGPGGRQLLGYAMAGLGQVRFTQGRWQEAEDALRAAIEVCRQTGGPSDPCATTSMRNLGDLYVAQGQLREAEPLLEELIEILRTAPGQPEILAAALRSLGRVYVAQGRFKSAEPLLQESLEVSKQMGESHPVFADSLVELGELYRVEHNGARGEPLLKKAVRIYEATGDTHLVDALDSLGMIAVEDGKYTVAREYLEPSLKMCERLFGAAHLATARVQSALAQAYLGERNYGRAESLIQNAMSTTRSLLGEDNYGLARLLMIAGNIAEQQRHRAQAADDYREALHIFRKTVRGDHPDLAAAEKNYRRFAKSFHE